MPERSINETQRARHQKDEGNAIGLTEAFAPVDDGFSSFDEALPSEDEVADAEQPVKRGRHARHARTEGPSQDASVSAFDVWDAQPEDRSALGVIGAAAQVDEAPDGAAESRRSRRQRVKDELPRYMKKSRRTRNVLIAAIAALVLLAAVGGFYTWQLVMAAQEAAEEMAAESLPSEQGIESEATDDASSVAAKKVSAPNLVSLLGLSADAALSQLGEGAVVSSAVELNAKGERLGEEDELASTEYTVSLTHDASDTRMGFPSVYLVADAKGVIERAGYSTTTTLLGFGSQSFEDVVTNGHVVEATLDEAGVSVPEGAVSLPADKADYSTYAEDGTTLERERCSFSGKADSGEGEVSWSAVLSYDYTMYNATGNLGDTVRVIYVYVE